MGSGLKPEADEVVMEEHALTFTPQKHELILVVARTNK